MNKTTRLNLTLVAFYGPKPAELAYLINTIQAELSEQLGDAFTPSEMDQVHATFVGLEGIRTGKGVLNTNLVTAGAAPAAMNLDGLFRHMRSTNLLPLHVCIGGFGRSVAYPFTSRGLHPYYRSFVLHGREAVVIGWPAKDGDYPMSLDRLRRQCMDYNVLHKYHQAPGDTDNDLFFVLGRVMHGMVSEAKVNSVQSNVRKLLSSLTPLNTLIRLEELSVVEYKDRSLPISSSSAYTLAEAQCELEELTALCWRK